MVTNLLDISHKQWTARNGVVHEKAPNGLPLEEAAQLANDITAQFNMGTTDLLARDHYLIDHTTLEAILDMQGEDQYIWLDTIQTARTIANETTDLEVTNMQQTLANWLHPQQHTDES